MKFLIVDRDSINSHYFEKALAGDEAAFMHSIIPVKCWDSLLPTA
ncbi:MAG: hypothetical protein U0X76_08740 [Bacteroidia bacterium]